MTITNGYATLAEYKAWITMRGSDVSFDVSDDVVIEDLIESASRYFDRETGKRFYKDSTDQTRYYTAENNLIVDIDPISASPTSVSVDTTGLRSYTALTGGTDFEVLPYNAALKGQPYTQLAIITSTTSYYFPITAKGIKVVGKFGYPSAPDDVKTATLEIAQALNNMRSGQSSGGNITVTAAGIVIRPQEVPPYAQRVISHYRSIV